MTPSVRTVDERGGAWLRVVLDRPPANLLSLEMVRAIGQALDAHERNRRKWITFEGAGEHFSYGAKIEEHVPGVMERVLPEAHALLRRILALPCCTAALVQGRCLGGGFELALACDLIVATGDASFGLPEIQLGVFPPAAAALLPLRLGVSRAAEAILTGTQRTGEWWRAAGVVVNAASPGGLHAAAGEWFDAHLAPRSAVAVAASALASRLVLRAAAEPALAELERAYLQDVLPTDDASEGVRAFVEKRHARWKDR